MSNGRRGVRMTKDWTSIPSTSFALTANATSAIASLPFTFAQTVIRMLGEYTIGPSSAPVATDAAQVAIGIGIISTDAFNVGGAALPDPAGNPEYPWLYWAEHAFHFPSTSLLSGADDASIRRSFDIRSMRKAKQGQSLVFVVQYVNVSGNPPLLLLESLTRVLVAH